MATRKKKTGDEIEIVIPEVLKKQEMPTFQDPDGSESYPTLLSLMSPVHDDRGRLTWEAAKISLTVKSGFLRATIACPTRQCQATITLHSVCGCWDAIEKALIAGELQWEETYDRVKEDLKLLKAAKKEMAKKP